MRIGKPRGDDRSPVVPVSGKGRKTEDVDHQRGGMARAAAACEAQTGPLPLAALKQCSFRGSVSLQARQIRFLVQCTGFVTGVATCPPKPRREVALGVIVSAGRQQPGA